MLKSLLLVATLIFTGGYSYAQASLDEAERLLTRDLLAQTKTLKNSIKLYNRFSIEQNWPEFNTEAGRVAYVNRYLAARAGDFWGLKVPSAPKALYNGGAGLYLAIDPVIAEDFGHMIIQMEVPAGTRFINVVKPIPVAKDTREALIRSGVVGAHQWAELFPGGFYRDTLRLMLDPKYDAFRSLVHRIFQRQGYEFVEYNFNTSLQGFCRTHSYSAFVFVGQYNSQNPKEALISNTFSRITMFSTKFEMQDRLAYELDEQDFIYKLVRVIKGSKALYGKSRSVIQSYILGQYSAEEYNQIKRSLFSCEQ